MISTRIKDIIGSPTMKIAAKAITMKASGIDLIDFSVGEPDFPTPENIAFTAKQAIDAGFTKYTANSGLAALKTAVCQKLASENNLSFLPSEIIVSNGAKQALFNVIMSVISPGDEVLIPAPYYVSYPEMIKLAGGIPIIVQASQNFKISPMDLKKQITNRTRAMVLCNPSNPTGSVFSYNELKALAEYAYEKKLFVISDEIYEKLTYDKVPFTSFGSVHELDKDQVAIINGVSKSYAMTGWRIGYAAASEEIISAAGMIQSHTTSGASTISQYAAVEALNGPQDFIAFMNSEFAKRRDILFNLLENISGIKCIKPQGAFYIFPDVSAFFGKNFKDYQIRNSSDLALFLLENASVALVPGQAFGSDNHIRISYSTSLENITEGMERIARALKLLK